MRKILQKPQFKFELDLLRSKQLSVRNEDRDSTTERKRKYEFQLEIRLSLNAKKERQKRSRKQVVDEFERVVCH